MQLNYQSFSIPWFDRATSVRQDSARRQKPSVTFPPIQLRQDEQRGSLAPAAPAGRRELQRESILSPRRDNNAWDVPRADAAAVAATTTEETGPRPDTFAVAADQHRGSPRTSPPPTQPSSHAVPPTSLPKLKTANKADVHQHFCSFPPTASQESLSARGSVSYAGKGPASSRVTSSFRDVMTQVGEEELHASRLLCDGKIGAALNALRMAIQKAQESASLNHRQKRGSLSSSSRHAAYVATPANQSPELAASLHSASTAPSSSSIALAAATAAAWRAETSQRLAIIYTVAASNAGVRCGLTAESLDVQQAYFKAAMRYLVESSDETLFPEWRTAARPSSSRAKMAGVGRCTPFQSINSDVAAKKRDSKASKSAVGFYLAGNTEFDTVRYQLLRCAVRNNAAVCLADRFSRGGRARTVYELLKALVDSRGVWSGVVLYNLAVAFLGVEHYDDAAEAIARYMELSYFYLNATERLQHDPLSTPSAAASAMHAIVALQLIRGHHFIAAMAAWCDPAGAMEVQHCEMALGCARQYLSSTDAKQHECQRRLAAARARAKGALSPVAAAAPLLPYMTQSFLFPGGALSGGSNTAMSAVTGTMNINVLVGGLYSIVSSSSLSPAADLPEEVRAYVKAAQKKDTLRFWVKEAQRYDAAPPFLSASNALAPLPVILLPLSPANDSTRELSTQGQKSTSPRGGSSSKHQQNQRQLPALLSSSARSPSPTLMSLPQHSKTFNSSEGNLPATYRPSKPAPCFITTLPESTFHRYRNLRASIVTRFESDEVASTGAITSVEKSDTNGHEPSVAEGTPPLAVETDTEPRNASGNVSGRSRRMTALLCGPAAASATADPLLVKEQWMTTHATPRLNNNGRSKNNIKEVVASDKVCETVKSSGEAAGFGDILAVSVRPSELLRQLDTETETCYSRLVADPLADVHRQAAIRLQSWWRAQLAHRERTKRSAEVSARCTEEAEAFRIQCAFRVWQQRKRWIAEREKVHQTQCRLGQLCIVQAFLRHRHSLELWGRACVAWYRQLLFQQLISNRQHDAVVKLQSWWRMCAAQRTVRAAMKAVMCLQALWRGACVRRELRRQRVHRRLAEESYYERHLPFLLCVQRWWRRCQRCLAARALVRAKQQAVAAYLSDAQSSHDEALRLYLRNSSTDNSENNNADNAVAAMRVVLAVLTGACDRRRLGVMHRYAQIRNRAIHRYVLRLRGCEVQRRLRHERDELLSVARRREEVAVATLRLQRWARLWLPQGRAKRLVMSEAASKTSVTKIQRAWRAYRVRRKTKAPMFPGEEVSKLDNDFDTERQWCRRKDSAARRIQTWYRLWHSADYVGNNQNKNDNDSSLVSQQAQDAAALSIQLCWPLNGAKARTPTATSEEIVPPVFRTLAPNAAYAYATWIQAFARSLLVRRTPQEPVRKLHTSTATNNSLCGPVRRFHVLQPPTMRNYKRSTPSSSGIVLPETSSAAAETDTSADATVPRYGLPTLLGFFHGVASSSSLSITPKAGDHARTSPSCSTLPQSLSRLTSSTDKPLYYFFSDSIYGPYSAGRTQAFSSSTESEYTDEGSEETEQEEVEGDEEAEASSTHSECTWLASRTRFERNGGKRELDDEDSIELMVFHHPHTATTATASAVAAFPIPRPPAPRRIMCTVHCCHTPEEIAAATHIQAVWRGFRVRSDIEYYYEEYYEEVDEDDEEEVDEDDEEEVDEDDEEDDDDDYDDYSYGEDDLGSDGGE